MKYGNVPYRGKLIIIDDEPSLSDRLAKWLKNNGYYYAFVDNDKDATDLLKHEYFDAVVYSHELSFNKSVNGKF